MDALELGHASAVTIVLEKGASAIERCKENVDATHFAVEGSMPGPVVQAVLRKAFGQRESLAKPLPVMRFHGLFPENIDNRNGKTFNTTRPAGVNDDLFKFEIRFCILHVGNSVDFSVGHGSDGATDEGGIVRILLKACEERMAKRTDVQDEISEL